ncbi:MAG TPA: ElyC/SanA/YdcF family protein [Candidatus Paceibacterota bacterium]|nr:ElyC/SanA/YdcF family protein [Candidatus Paceibacterota bacterium]
MNRFVRIGFLLCICTALAVLLVPILMRASVDRFLFTSLVEVPSAEVAIVPGASVFEGEPSPVLAARANAAIALFQMGKVSRILVTGDNSALNHDEVSPVRRYLLAAGIPADDIFLDHAGFDTYSSMYRAKVIFGVASAIIVTQDFHLPRALFLARELGIQAYGYDAGGPASISDYLREIPAADKALFDLLVARVPKFLGPMIPISGSGVSTWY